MDNPDKHQYKRESLPARGAWVEIGKKGAGKSCYMGRSPHGERGLKSQHPQTIAISKRSLPARGAWVEIDCAIKLDLNLLVAPRTGSVG